MNRTILFSAFLLFAAPVHAQRGGGGGQPAAPPAAKAAAPIDLTGYWVALVTEDWRFRMVTPKKGDFPSIPLNNEGRRVANLWDPDKDLAAGEQCRSYGAANIMRVPGNLHITWESDNSLRIDTDAGTQTRMLNFGAAPPPAGPATWQGSSVAQWEISGGGRGRGAPGAPPRAGDLKVVTTRMRPGYLQKNGVPYGANAVLTEYFHRTTEPNGDSLLFVTTMVEDPQYLNQAFVRSTHFKKLADGSGWNPTPCAAK